MFGRPKYFFGGDELPGSTSASSNESAVALGADETIVGACWNGETHLLVTSAHSVRDFHIDHLHVPLRTWNFRPDQEHLLTSSAVIVGRKRSSSSSPEKAIDNAISEVNSSAASRSIVAVQDFTRVIAWEYNDESLDSLRQVELPSPVAELLGGFFPDIAIAVSNRGDVFCLDSDLQTIGSLEFELDSKFCSPRSATRSTSRLRRRSRSNSNLDTHTQKKSLNNSSTTKEENPEWVVHWAKHAPFRSTASRKSVLLFVLLRKGGDPSCNDLLIIHEVSRPRGANTAVTMKTIIQHDMGIQVQAASIGIDHLNSGVYKHTLQIIGRNVDASDSQNAHHFHVMTFPDGPHGPPVSVAAQRVPSTDLDFNEAKDLKDTQKRRRTSFSAPNQHRSSAKEVAKESNGSFAIVSLTHRHSVIAKLNPSDDGISCSGWDSGFCIPVANMMVPCRSEDTFHNEGIGCGSSSLKLELCNDRKTVALVGKKNLAIFAVQCPEANLANAVGCGQELGTTLSINKTKAICIPENTQTLFSGELGLPVADIWDPETGSGAIAGENENNALKNALGAASAKEFNAAVLNYLDQSSPAPLLTQNYIRASVGACHSFGLHANDSLIRLISTGRVSAWACPTLIPTVLKSSKQMLESKKNKSKSGKKRRRQSTSDAKDSFLLIEYCLRHVQDLHENAIVELLQFIIRSFDSSDGDSLASFVRLLRSIVALPYNGSFLQTFLRRLSPLETRLMLAFMRKIIKEEAERESADAGSPTMSQAVGWTTILLDAHFQSIVVGSRSENKTLRVISTLAKDIHDLVETCQCAERIKAQVNHLKQSKRLPFEPVPAYSIEKFHAFDIGP